jgi:hypothetical protein
VVSLSDITSQPSTAIADDRTVASGKSSHGIGDSGGGGDGFHGGSSALALSSGSSSGTPAAVEPFSMSPDEEKDAVKSVVKALPVFKGGTKATEEWPSFWSRISSILRYSTYSPRGPLATTAENAENSNRLYVLLIVKLGSPADLPFLNNPAYDGRGFEMLARLKQTYAPSEKGDLYSNFVALVFLEQRPQDSVEFVASRIRNNHVCFCFVPPISSCAFFIQPNWKS